MPYVFRQTRVIDGVQRVPGEVLERPYGAGMERGEKANSDCRVLGEGEGTVRCEDCEARFSATYQPDPLSYHRRLVHNDPPADDSASQYPPRKG